MSANGALYRAITRKILSPQADLHVLKHRLREVKVTECVIRPTVGVGEHVRGISRDAFFCRSVSTNNKGVAPSAGAGNEHRREPVNTFAVLL